MLKKYDKIKVFETSLKCMFIFTVSQLGIFGNILGFLNDQFLEKIIILVS